MKRLIILLMVLSAILVNSCGTTGSAFKQMFGQDPDPPEGYNPVFLSEIKQIENSPLDSTQVVISRIDPYKDGKVRLFVHIVEGGNTFLSGGAKNPNKKIWCSLIDSVNGVKYEIKDFKIRESTNEDRKPQAIAIVMDHSGSMGQNRALEVQKAVDNFLNLSKKKDDYVALVKYDDSVGVECALTKDIIELKGKFSMDGLGTYGKGTATLDAIAAGIGQLSNAKAGLERIVMVFTDGMDGSSKRKMNDIIKMARQNNVMVCAIDYGIMIQKDFLEKIAKETNGTYHHIYLAREFNLVYRDIYQRLEKFYEIEYNSPDFGSHTVTLKLCEPVKNEPIAVNTYDNVPYEGMATILDINFDTNKDVIKSESMPVVNRVATMMRQNPRMTIELHGHTDSRGNKDSNLKLSNDRANSVKNALIKQGIDGSRISAKGFGDTSPIDSNETESGRAKNRRTEFIVISR